MSEFTPIDPARKREQMAAGTFYLALVARINDPQTKIPFYHPLPGPITPADLERLNERFRHYATSEEKYVVEYNQEPFIDIEECARTKYSLYVTFGPRPTAGANSQ